MHNVQDSKFVHEYMVKRLSSPLPWVSSHPVLPEGSCRGTSLRAVWISFNLPDSAWGAGMILFFLYRLQSTKEGFDDWAN